MYHDELSREAKLIVQGWQEYLRELTAVRDRLLARLGSRVAVAAAPGAARL